MPILYWIPQSRPPKWLDPRGVNESRMPQALSLIWWHWTTSTCNGFHGDSTRRMVTVVILVTRWKFAWSPRWIWPKYAKVCQISSSAFWYGSLRFPPRPLRNETKATHPAVPHGSGRSSPAPAANLKAMTHLGNRCLEGLNLWQERLFCLLPIKCLGYPMQNHSHVPSQNMCELQFLCFLLNDTFLHTVNLLLSTSFLHARTCNSSANENYSSFEIINLMPPIWNTP